MATPFVGEIRIFAGNFPPVGWAFCNGQQITIAENDTLYAVIGTTYGGDGVQTFNLPNLVAHLPIGQGQGPGLTPRVMGQNFGSDTVTLTRDQIPAHNHTVMASADLGNENGPQNATLAAVGAAGSSTLFYSTASVPGTLHQLSSQTLANTGGSLPHENMMPTLTLNYIIATQGIFPSQG